MDRSDKTHYVIFHHPGSKWKRGRDLFEQDGVQEHVQHYYKLNEEGKLYMGGPFLSNNRGGMMVANIGVGKEELEEFAAADPAVKSGLLVFRGPPLVYTDERELICGCHSPKTRINQ